MTIELPGDLDRTLSAEDLRLRLGIGLFISEDLTLAQAFAYARISRSDFLKELDRLGIDLRYGVQEAAEDLETLRNAGLM